MSTSSLSAVSAARHRPYAYPVVRPPQPAAGLPVRYTELKKMQNYHREHKRKKTSAKDSASPYNVMLNAEELAFLLGKKDEELFIPPATSKQVDVFLQRVGKIQHVFLGQTSRYFWLCLLIAVPVLGAEASRLLFGTTVHFAISALTACVGAYVMHRQGTSWLKSTLRAIRERTVPSISTLQKVVMTFSGLLLILPGPFTDCLALLLVLPSSSRFCSVLLARLLGSNSTS